MYYRMPCLAEACYKSREGPSQSSSDVGSHVSLSGCALHEQERECHSAGLWNWVLPVLDI